MVDFRAFPLQDGGDSAAERGRSVKCHTTEAVESVLCDLPDRVAVPSPNGFLAPHATAGPGDSRSMSAACRSHRNKRPACVLRGVNHIGAYTT